MDSIQTKRGLFLIGIFVAVLVGLLVFENRLREGLTTNQEFLDKTNQSIFKLIPVEDEQYSLSYFPNSNQLSLIIRSEDFERVKAEVIANLQSYKETHGCSEDDLLITMPSYLSRFE
jgi:hypothetical protein